ncbi:hypothetical protein [Vitreoscilla stercoraria]|uniref:Uncharacterized protein n=1 Tax=Vitreoscilla stercoraria TaxID=61 RepID=A0ABY4EFS5_VITST|nr:hypothetical protein [Vitreoscilla stercoraria]UOO93573.1 hypothetical protein LVJ81_05990 [Vitreoscilla stercoraria]
MNIKSVFESLFEAEQLSVARISTQISVGTYQATTQNGHPVILTGNAQVNQMVFYDMRTGKITGQAPDVDVVDLPV